MRVSIHYKNTIKRGVGGVHKDMVDFANSQFQLLIKKNLGIPVKSFRL